MHVLTVTLTSSADSVRPGDTVVFTCVTDTAPLVWSTSVNELVKVYHSSHQVNEPAVNIGGIFTVKLANTTGQFESTTTAYNVSPDYNGVNITCNNEAYSSTSSVAIGENSMYKQNVYKSLFCMYILATLFGGREFLSLVCKSTAFISHRTTPISIS